MYHAKKYQNPHNSDDMHIAAARSSGRERGTVSHTKIRYEIRGQVALVLLDDPETLNAMSNELADELMLALQRASAEAGAVIVGTTGRAFCAGANLASGGIDLADPERDMGARLERIINPIVITMREAPIPVVTAVRGAAAGVGCGLALAGDLIVAEEAAFFYLAFAKVGLTPDGGASYFLSRAIGRVRAMELMLLGGRLPAAKALDWGLINRVVPADELDRAALAIAQQLAEGPRSIGMIKASAWSAVDTPLEAQLAVEREWQRAAGRTEDFVEGVASFREKRPAQFKRR